MKSAKVHVVIMEKKSNNSEKDKKCCETCNNCKKIFFRDEFLCVCKSLKFEVEPYGSCLLWCPKKYKEGSSARLQKFDLKFFKDHIQNMKEKGIELNFNSYEAVYGFLLKSYDEMKSVIKESIGDKEFKLFEKDVDAVVDDTTLHILIANKILEAEK